VPLKILVELDDLHNFSRSSLALLPEIAYYPLPNACITLGVHAVVHSGTTFLGNLINDNEGYLRLSVSY